MTIYEFANCKHYPSWRHVSLVYIRNCPKYEEAPAIEIEKRVSYFEKRIQANKSRCKEKGN